MAQLGEPTQVKQPDRGQASGLSAWERVKLARHPQRPYALDFARLCFTDFTELHGDRHYADDAALIGGLASLEGQTVMVIGHQKGRDARENALRRFGMARPDGYRKALRLMRHAEKFRFPLVSLIDIPGADPSLQSEERGQAFAIATNLMAMARLRTFILGVIIGEGGSGGALAIGTGDRVLMLENAIYSVASPEASASILWRDSAKAPEAAEAMKITAPELLSFGIIDGIVPEPPGGAHMNVGATAMTLKHYLGEHLGRLRERYTVGDQLKEELLLQERHEKYRRIGLFQEQAPSAAD